MTEQKSIKLIVAWMVEKDFDCFPLSYESVKSVADAVVVVNGNHDETVTYIGDIPNATELRYPYPHEDKGADGKQRNKYLEFLKKEHPGAWVLVLDADEFVDKPELIKPYIALLEANNCDCCSPTMRHFVWNLACEDSTHQEHLVPMRLFKVKPELSYPEVEHNVLQGTTRAAVGSAHSGWTVWHMGYAKEMFTLHRKYRNHVVKSNIHNENFLTWWYHAHLFGEYPTRPVARHDLPKVLIDWFDINEDYIYFKDRKNELKYWEDAVQWADFFKPKTALEVGCGWGHRVRSLLRLGIDAHGFDISTWTVKNRPYPELEGRMWQGDVLNETAGYGSGIAPHDLVICYDILEHVEEKDIDTAIQNIRKWTNKWVLVSVPVIGDPNLLNDHTHRIFWTRDQWIAKFAEHRLATIPTPEHFQYAHQLIVLEKQGGDQ